MRQIVWPSGRPLGLPPGRWNRRYPWGQHRLDPPLAATLLVSRGAGYGGLPVRFFAPAEIVVATSTWYHATPVTALSLG